MVVDQLRLTLVWPLRLTQVATQDDLERVASAIRDGKKTSDHSPSQKGDDTAHVRSSTTEDKIWSAPQDRFHPDSPNATNYAEFVYFHPFVRRFLYEPREAKSPMRILERTDIRYLDTTIAVDPEGWSPDLPETKNVRFVVHSIRLHLFRTGVVVLSVELSTENQSLAVAQAALDQVRRAYRPYFEKWKDGPRSYKAGHCPLKAVWLDSEEKPPFQSKSSDYDELATHWKPVARTPDPDNHEDERQPPFAAHWKWLLPDFENLNFADGRKRICLHLLDERIPAMAFVAVKNPEQFTDGDFFRLGYMDERGSSDTLPYSTEFYEKFKRDAAYDRFWEPDRPGHGWMTTRYLTMGYSFVMIGSSKSDGFFMDQDAGALAHFRNHYFQLFLIAHFQHASLINFSHDLAILVDDIVEPTLSPKKIFQRMDDLRTRFADFVSRFWFDEISNQMQARELFDLIRKNLGTDRLYADVTNEIRNVAEVIAGRMQARVGNINLWFTLAAGFLGLMQLTKVRDAFVSCINRGACLQLPGEFADWHLELLLAVSLAVLAWRLYLRWRLPSDRKDR